MDNLYNFIGLLWTLLCLQSLVKLAIRKILANNLTTIYIVECRYVWDTSSGYLRKKCCQFCCQFNFNNNYRRSSSITVIYCIRTQLINMIRKFVFVIIYRYNKLLYYYSAKEFHFSFSNFFNTQLKVLSLQGFKKRPNIQMNPNED